MIIERGKEAEMEKGKVEGKRREKWYRNEAKKRIKQDL